MRRIRLPLLALFSFLALLAARPTAPAGDPAAECSQHLRAIHRALVAYERDHHRLPDQLSDLVPRHLADAKLLHCPADPTPGDPGRLAVEWYAEGAHRDTGLPTSYYYEFNGSKSWGVMGTQLGPFPRSDLPGVTWGTWRHINRHQRTLYGDRVPAVRCFHHPPVDREKEENVVNVTLGGQVYRSGRRWETHPDTVAGVLDRFARDLKTGRKSFERKWYVGGFEEYVYTCASPQHARRLRPQWLLAAERLQALAREQPAERKSHTLRVAALVLNTAGEYRRAVPVIRESRRLLTALPGKEWIEEGVLRGEAETQILARAYRGLGQHEKVIALFEPLVEKRTVSQNYYMRSLGDAYAALGQREKAEEWRLKADPARALVGEAAPGFNLPLLAGGQLTLQDALRGNKALLVNFWFYH